MEFAEKSSWNFQVHTKTFFHMTMIIFCKINLGALYLRKKHSFLAIGAVARMVGYLPPQGGL